MTVKLDYWASCISEAALECDLVLTPEQLEVLASAAESGHDNYSMAFYEPSWSDRISDIESEWKAKYKALEKAHEAYKSNAETAVKKALRVHRDDNVSIGSYGEVYAHGGRTTQIQ